MFRPATGKARMVEDKFRGRAMLGELEAGDGVNPGSPTLDAPSLNDALIRHKFDLTANDIPARLGAHQPYRRLPMEG